MLPLVISAAKKTAWCKQVPWQPGPISKQRLSVFCTKPLNSLVFSHRNTFALTLVTIRILHRCDLTLATVLKPLSYFSYLWREIKCAFYLVCLVFVFVQPPPPQFLQWSQVRLQVLLSLFCFYISVLYHFNLLCCFSFSFLKLICLYCWWQIFLFCKIYSLHFVNFSHCYCNKTHCDDPSINKSCT